MTTYLYNGAFTVDIIGGKEITLTNGKTYELNAEDKRVKTLVKLKQLTEIKVKKEKQTTERTK